MGKKLWTHIAIAHNVSVNTGNILMATIIFSRYDFLLTSNITFMTDSDSDLAKLERTQIRDLSNRSKWFSIPVAEHACFSHQARTPKTGLSIQFIAFLKKYYFKAGTLYLLLFCSHVLTALEFDSSYFVILLWKIVKTREHNEIKPPVGKIFQK